MTNLLTGYKKVTINPPLNIGISGYFVPRFAQGFLDDICASAFVLACDDERAVIISVDACKVIIGIKGASSGCCKG